MRVTLCHNRYLPLARALFRKSGYYLTVRHGRIFTIAQHTQRKSNTDAQLRCRNLFREAVRCVSDDMKRPGRKAYWEEVARREGKANSYTAARSYYLRKLKADASAASVQPSQCAAALHRVNPLSDNAQHAELTPSSACRFAALLMLLCGHDLARRLPSVPDCAGASHAVVAPHSDDS